MPDQTERKAAQAEDKQERSAARDEAKTDRKAEQAERKVQRSMDKETEQGFVGVEVDMTPNENYTVQGVVEGKPVPEAEADPVAARRDASNPEV
jgi:hypothetical protein